MSSSLPSTAPSFCEEQDVGTFVSSAAPYTLNIYLGVQVKALENTKVRCWREGMTRIPGVGRTSAAPSLENKEENERNVAFCSLEDAARWEKLVIREMGTGFVAEEGKTVVPGVISKDYVSKL